MTSKSLPAVLIAAILGTTALTALPALAKDKDATPALSRDVAKQLKPAVDALNAKDYKTALADIQAAQAVTDQTDFDKFRINEFLSIVYNDMENKAAAEGPALAAADSTVIPDADKADIYLRALALAEDNKHYDKAIAYGKKFESLGKPDLRVTEAMLQSYVEMNDDANTKIYLQKMLDAAAAAGKKPDEYLLQTEFNLNVKAHNEDGAAKALEQLAVNYNEAGDWQQLVDVIFSTRGMRAPDIIHLGRLLYASTGTVSKDDATLIAEAANQQGYYGDAQTSVAKGAPPVAGLAAKIAADKKGLAAQIAAGPGQGGQYNAKLAEALYGYGEYAQAETAARTAITKGGATDPTEAPMVLGEALFAQGKYADAAQAFAGVKGAPATARIAEVWQEYAQAKARDAAAPAAKPAQ
jgi:hypothetical protein